ncbi:MAG: Clp protease N-terminal domain-containing protein [Arthrobacter sp.]
MFERFTDTARRTVVLAQEEARILKHSYIAPNTCCSPLTGDTSPADQALAESGVTHEDARSRIVELAGEGLTSWPGHIPFTPAAAEEHLVTALRIALAIGPSHITSEHLLLALLADDKSMAGQALLRTGGLSGQRPPPR